MIPNDKAFNGKSSYTCDGKTFSRWYYFRDIGSYHLRFANIRTNSPNKQGLALFFSDFKGELFLNGRKLPVLKGKHQHYTFEVDQLPADGFALSVVIRSGCLYFGNASKRTETTSFTCGAFGNAFWTEALSENQIRFHCNDHEYDDDFDDLVFDLIIEKKAEV